MSPASRDAGLEWERRAARYLTGQGLTVVEHGYRCRAGEIDLICDDNGCLVIVEVRARRSGSHGTASESIDRHKRRKILAATRHYLMRHPQRFAAPLRFDVVAVDRIEDDMPLLEWIRNAFDGS